MKLHLRNTVSGLVPIDDYAYDEKRKLKIGEVYQAEVKLCRNYRFHKLYFALINCAWEYLPERQAEGFRSKGNFRKYVEVAAGYCEPFYSPSKQEWLEVPKSIAFDSMDEAEFRDLYDRVKDVIFALLGKYVSPDEFGKNLINF